MRAAVVDLDVHHGNGTASIFAGDPRVFTLSVHEEANYPEVKPAGSLDIGLARAHRRRRLSRARSPARSPGCWSTCPTSLFYLAGADPYADDQLGGLALSLAGLRRRDRLVFEAARSAGVPIVVVLAGGYARQLDDTVAIHAATIEEAARA